VSYRFQFDETVLNSVVGGHSAIDMPKLHIHSREEANAFMLGYGFNADNSEDLEKLWYFHRRALVLIQEKLGFQPQQVPEVLRDPKLLEDPRNILIYASSADIQHKNLQKWACALLRCMHVFVHAENDLFSSFSEDIQKQILAPFQNCIFHDGTTGTTFLKRPQDTLSPQLPEVEDGGALALLGFEVKPFKTSSSTVIKLLAKPDALAMRVFDKLGVRFVTRSMFDTFRVVRFLVEEGLISFAHIMPDQSSNNLYPVGLFLKAAAELAPKAHEYSDEQINRFFIDYLEKNRDQADFLRKENLFSGEDYRFIKFIARKLIRIEIPGATNKFSFFYPYEVQIVDQESHSKINSGPSHHLAYKERQQQAARIRLLPELG